MLYTAVISALLLSSSVVHSAVTCDCSEECSSDRLVEMGSILCYGYESCYGSYLRSRNNDIYCTGDRACSDALKIVAEENIYCNGNRACDQTVGDIESENGNVFCNGFKGCYKAESDISSYINVVCDGDHGCYSADGFITAATGHVTCMGEQSCYDVTGLISAETTIIAGGYYSAAYSEMNSDFGAVYCEGELSCYNGDIQAQTIDCSGLESCYEAELKSDDELILVGGHAGSSAEINAVTTYAYGAYSASYSNIRSEDLPEINVNLFGYYAGEYANIWCNSGSTCNIECVGMGCYKTMIYYWSGSDVNIEPVECKYGTTSSVTDAGVACPSLVLLTDVNATAETCPEIATRQRERKKSVEFEQLTAKVAAKNEKLSAKFAAMEERELERTNLQQQLFSEGGRAVRTKSSSSFIQLVNRVEAMPVSATLSIGAAVGTVCSLALASCWSKARMQKKYELLK